MAKKSPEWMTVMRNVCCDDMMAATKPGTDAGEYGSAIWVHDGQYRIGSVSAVVNFCPWCGLAIARELRDVPAEFMPNESAKAEA